METNDKTFLWEGPQIENEWWLIAFEDMYHKE
jgi:hypothetical protein